MNNRTYRLPRALRLLSKRTLPHKLGICERLFGSSLARREVCWVELGDGLEWKIDLGNPTHRWIVYGSYQGTGFWNWARKALPADSVIVDSGANIGQTVIFFAALPQVGSIFAFEPGMEAFSWLDECVRRNRMNGVETVRAALADVAGRGVLRQEGPANTHGAWDKVRRGGEGQRIPVTTLDEFIATRQLPRVDLWKLDMEGGELRALKGAAASLDAGRVKHLLVEISGESGREIPNYLSAFGFRPLELTTWGRARPLRRRSDYQDVLFSAAP